MNKIYIVFSQTYTILSRIIKVVAKEKYSHVSLSLNKDLSDMYSFGRKYTNNPFIGRFVYENVKKGVFAKNKNCIIKVFEITLNNQQFKNLKKRINHYKDNIKDYKYNAFGLILARLGIRKNRKNKMYCAEFVYDVLSYEGVNIIPKTNEAITLQTVKNDKDFTLIYEGFAKDY